MGRQSKSEIEAAEFVNQLYDTEQRRQLDEHPRWYRNLAFFHGDQWVWWNPRYNFIEELPRTEDWQIRMVINRTRDIVRRIVARLTRNDPRFVPLAVGRTEADRLSAEAYKDFLNYLWSEEQMRRTMREQVLPWSVVTGQGWLETYWDPDYGRLREYPAMERRAELATDGDEINEIAAAFGINPKTGEELTDETELLPDGGIRFRSISPFNVFKDPAAESNRQMRWVMKATFHHVQSVEDAYGLQRGSLEPDCTNEVGHGFSQRVLTGLKKRLGPLLGRSGGVLLGQGEGGKYIRVAGLYDGNDTSNMVLVKELWTRPTNGAPEGRNIVVAGKRVLNMKRNRSLDNPTGELPLTCFPCYQKLGSTYGQGVVDDIYPLQVALNRLYSNFMSISNLNRGRQWLVHDMSAVDLRAFNDRPTQVIRYKGPLQAPPPRPVDPPSFGSEFLRGVEAIERQMNEVSSVREVSKGENVSGGRSAAVVRQLQAADEEGQAPLRENYMDSLTDTARVVGKFVERYHQEDRAIPVVSKGGGTNVTLFKKADITHCLSVRVQGDVGLPQTMLGRLNMVLDMLQFGLLDPQNPTEKQTILKLLDSADIEGIFDMDEPAERLRVFQENMAMLEGDQVPVKPYDLHLVHAEEHGKFFRSVEWQTAIAENPALEALGMQHQDQHIRALEGTQPVQEPSSGAGSRSQPTDVALLEGLTGGPSPAGGGIGA